MTAFRPLGVVLVGASLAFLVDHAVVAGQDDDRFKPGNLVVSRSVYAGNASIVTAGDTLPPGCVPGNVNIPLILGGTTPVAVVGCTKGIADGTYPGVFENNTVDGSFDAW
jgi:hypothetical protein